MLAERGNLDEAAQIPRTRADAGDGYAALDLAEPCELDDLRARASADDRHAVWSLAELLATGRRGAEYRRFMAGPITQRQVALLIERCYAGLDAAALHEEILRRIRRIVSVDAAFFGTVDPATLLFTSAVAEEPLQAAGPLFLENEFAREDVNKFAVLAESGDPVGSLDQATRSHRPASARYREIMGPLGLGDELRAAFIAKKSCWGVICLHREDTSYGFDGGEVDLIRRISPHVAEGLRRAVIVGSAAVAAASTAGTTPATVAGTATPGIIVLDAGLTVVSMSLEAERWLAEIDEAEWPRMGALPAAVYVLAARVSQLEDEGLPALQPPATIRLRSCAGQWLSLYASRLRGAPAPQIAVVIEPTSATQIGSLLLSAFGLTGAQSRVVALVVRGYSTRQIVRELHISANTVQEHLTAAFGKFGVRSRRELVAALLTGPQ